MHQGNNGSKDVTSFGRNGLRNLGRKIENCAMEMCTTNNLVVRDTGEKREKIRAEWGLLNFTIGMYVELNYM